MGRGEILAIAMALACAGGCAEERSPDDADAGGQGGQTADASPADAGAADAGPGAADAGASDSDAGAPDAGAVPACTDPADQDADGFGGYPTDPGCTDLDDDDESDDCPFGPGCSACGNAVDDDRDADVDYPADVGCAAASDDDESDECVPGLDVIPFENGTVFDLEAGPDQVHAFRVDRHFEFVRVTFASAPPEPLPSAVITFRYADCDDPAADLICTNNESMFRFGDPALGTYYLFVDSLNGGLGNYLIDTFTIVPSGTECFAGSACVPTELCGFPVDNICRPVACWNGIDDNGDGLVDWPEDPSCPSPSTRTEQDGCPGGAICPPVCANGIDDDGDFLIDLDDPLCASASMPDEGVSCPVESDPMLEITGPSITGTTVGATSDFILAEETFCGDFEGGDGGAPDRVHWMVLPSEAFLVVTNNDSFPAAIAATSRPCTSIDDACMEPKFPTGFQDTSAGPGVVYFVVDGVGGQSGEYDFTISGTFFAGEACDQALIDAGIMQCEEFTSCIEGFCQY
jgi:hypothetical protein